MSGYAGWTLERAPINDATIPILADGIKWLGYLPKQGILWNLGVYVDWLSEGQGFSTYDTQIIGRLAWLPIASEQTGTLLHVGVSGRYGKPNERKLKLRSRPEAFPTEYFVDTGDFACEETKMLALEGYYRPGPLLVGTEYFFQWADAAEAGDPFFHGGDVVVTWLLTGETRKYNTRGGFFNMISTGQDRVRRWPRSLGSGAPGLLHRPRRRYPQGRPVLADHSHGELVPVRQPPPGAGLRLRPTRSLRPDRRHAVLPEPLPAHVLER